MPREIGVAKMIDALCQRWHCPPTVVLEQPSDLVALILEAAKADATVAAEEEQDGGAASMEATLLNLSKVSHGG